MADLMVATEDRMAVVAGVEGEDLEAVVVDMIVVLTGVAEEDQEEEEGWGKCLNHPGFMLYYLLCVCWTSERALKIEMLPHPGYSWWNCVER